MNCRDVRWMLSLYDSGELSSEEQKIAETHLASCEKCRQELARISGVPALIQSLHDGTWWADVSSSVREQIDASVREGTPPGITRTRADKKGAMVGVPGWRPTRIGSIAEAFLERPVWQRALVIASAVFLIALTSWVVIRPWQYNNISRLVLNSAQNNAQVQSILGESETETDVVVSDGIASVKFSTADVIVSTMVNVEDLRVMSIHVQALTFLPPGPPPLQPELTEDEKVQAAAIAEGDPYVQIFLSHGLTLGGPTSSHHVLGEDTRRVAWLPLEEDMLTDDYRGVVVNLNDAEDVTIVWGGELPDWWPFTQ
ncbi:MAG: zf-HC2 domain-containing protein [Dehalococcoidia bacterium]